MKLIAITGYKRSGKTTVAEQIMRMHLPARSKHINFADAVKREVCMAFHITREYLDEHKENFRLILQGLGTDVGRKLRGETYWIGKWIESINNLTEPMPSLIVCSDLRFKNEADCIRKCNGIIIRVYRQGATSDGHASETELDAIVPDFTVHNDGTVEDLRQKLKLLNL